MNSGKIVQKQSKLTQASKILNYASMKFHSGALQPVYRKVRF